MDIAQIVDDFNSTLTDLINNIADICPDTLISDNKNIIKKMLSKPDTRTKAIDTFVAKILIYKPQIDRGDEKFFLGKSYDDDLTNVSNGSDSNTLSTKIFEFKNIWKSLSPENKDFVIQYMQLLCLLAQNYFLLMDTSN